MSTKVSDNLIDKIHREVNERIHTEYPLLGEDYIKRWIIRYILEIFEGLKNER